MIKIVYYISNGKNIKIGITNDIRKRMRTLQCGSPYKLTLLAYEEVEDSRARESELHKLYSNYRVNGEWFSVNDHLLEHINNISKYYIEYENNEIRTYKKMSK